MNYQDFKKNKLPDKPGVYFFLKNGKVQYIGKATSLHDRVRSYFGKDLIVTRGPLLLDMITVSTSIKWQETDSVLEALILEANLIKKYQPKYNTKEKDNKSFNYVCITKPARSHKGAGGEQLPKILIVRGREIDFAEKNFFSGPGTWGKQSVPDHSKNLFFSKIFGPFPNGLQLREAMKIIRRIFPYIDNDSNKKNNIEFYKQLGLIPDIATRDRKNKSSFPSWSGPSSSQVPRPEEKKLFSDYLKEYKKNIKNIKLFFEGKKKRIISDLKREMFAYAKKNEFEKAGEIKKKIFALEHINDVALIKDDIISTQHISGSNRLSLPRPAGSARAHTYDFHQTYAGSHFRIEAYDIAHMSGENMVGVMTVMENGELAKGEYKKFIIRTQSSSNDTGALEEVLSRRFRHTEWGLPNLIVMDGSTAQVNVAKAVLNRYQFKIPIVAVIKDDRHKAKAIMGDELIIKRFKKDILLINSESHRFAITFHKKRRNKNFLL